MRKILAFLQRDLRAWSSYRFTAALQLAGILFALTVFFFISEAVEIKDRSAILAYADNYFDFVVIGLAVSGFVTTSLSGFASHVRDAQISGTLEALLVTPTSIPALVVGSTLWDYVSATLRFAGFLAVGALAFDVPLHWERIGWVALILALVIAAFSGIGLLSAAFVMVFKRGDPLAQAVAWFSILLGGVYYPVSATGNPTITRLADLLPVTPALHALRLLLLRGAPFAEVESSVGTLALMAALLLPLGLGAFDLGVRRARVSGSLTHY